MRLLASIRCPACLSTNCRGSRWHSSREKHSHPECRPYRCSDCQHRFILPRPKKSVALAWISTGLALAAVVLFAFILLMPSLTDVKSPASPGASTSPVLNDEAILRAAKNGDPDAQFKLGDALFQDPARTDKSSVEAMRWLESSAAAGNVEAMIYLGRVLRTGVGVLQDFTKAALWIQTAATHGDPEGMLEMGRLCRDGVGVEKDPIKAYAWLNRAAAARNIDAVREREAIVHILTPEQLKEAQRQSSLPAEE
jgi:hypothetical protein